MPSGPDGVSSRGHRARGRPTLRSTSSSRGRRTTSRPSTIRAHRHAYLERPRGHAKTSTSGPKRSRSWSSARRVRSSTARRPTRTRPGCSSTTCWAKFQRNPLLAPLIKVTRRVLTSPVARSDVDGPGHDAPSAYGLRPDWIAIDELAEWRGRALVGQLVAATGKRATVPDARASARRAGTGRRIAWGVREIASGNRTGTSRPAARAPRGSARRGDSSSSARCRAHVFARLHLNQWVEGVGAFLTAPRSTGSSSRRCPCSAALPCLGLDLGLSKDKTVLALVRGDPASNLVAVESLMTWTARAGDKVDLTEVEAAVPRWRGPGGEGRASIPGRRSSSAQRLRARGLEVVEYPFTGESRRKLFSTVLAVPGKRAADLGQPRRHMVGR